MNKRQPSTMQQLAATLGLSRTTVSLVLKGEAERYRIPAQTKQRVLDAVKNLNYRPNYFARALNTRRSGTIGVLFPNVFETFMSEVVKGIEDVLYPADFTLMLSTSRFSRPQEVRVIEQFIHRGVDGIIVVFTAPFKGETHDFSHLHHLAASQTPVVFADRVLPDIRIDTVVQDDYHGAVQAVKALFDSGARRPALVSLDIDVSTIHDRIKGFDDAVRVCAPQTPAMPQLLLKKRDPDAHDLEQLLVQAAALALPPDSFFVTTNGIAHKLRFLLSAIRYPHAARVPIATFGADPPYCSSGMVCVRQPHIEMGRKAAELLLRRIGKPRPRRFQTTVIPVTLSYPIPTLPERT